VFSGGGGVALFLCEAARLRGARDLLRLARSWCTASRQWSTSAAAQADPASPGQTRFGLFTGEVGLCCVEALVSLQEGDRSGFCAAADRIDLAAGRLGEAADQAPQTEFLGGAAGILCATRFLGARVPPGSDGDHARAALDIVRDRMLALLMQRHAKALEPGPDDLLGLAHGVAGELWALVHAIGAHHETASARLAELAALGEFDENGLLYWLPRAKCSTPLNAALLGSWCNGMAGHTLLWCAVARQTRSEPALELARLCAQTTARLAIPLPTLCCGLAGASLALQRYAELSGDVRYRRRAYALLVRAARLAGTDEALPFAPLMQGTLGVALVVLERLHGERSIPLLEPT
jgi:hypothetical protein